MRMPPALMWWEASAVPATLDTPEFPVKVIKMKTILPCGDELASVPDHPHSHDV